MEPFSPATGNSHAARPRLLLVEDNDSVRAATELFLKFEGYDVSSAASPEEADQMFESARNADILISDFHLDADRTGLDLLTGLRRRLGFDVPGIILTGDLPSVLRRSGSAVANCRFLPKPVDTQALIDAISELGKGR
jgi:CheY-like chemotaxis protein